ncbi:hypothetical protein CS022_09415 [Veronia nyctiphanis]|uniref:Type IV pilus assembly protein PilM n=1 Tax=Veronia nyctiphanis TaxID=1278244 RepID=A0A4Q0YQN9_9GAMM|nr:pilus assembly protein PilM [Veronia nyctiphanis]RXJ73457.1 hypothetical protein CS022_09415 [Veronia nyctiphanis]
MIFRKHASVGIEIAANRARLAVLERKGEQYHIRQLQSVAFNSAKPEVCAKALKRYTGSYTGLFGTSNQVMSVAEGDVIFKRLPLVNAETDEESHAQIGIHLSESLGVALEELFYDYQVQAEENAVEAFACRKSALAKELNALEKAGFSLSVLDLKPFALMRLYQHQIEHASPTGLPLLVDVGYTKTQFCLYQPHLYRFHREIAFGTTYSMSNMMEGNEQAFTESLAGEIQRLYQLAGSQLSGEQINQIWLSGVASQMVDTKHLTTLLNKPVEVFDPFVGFQVKDKVHVSSEEPIGAYSTALGLALRGLSHVA